MDFFAKYNLSLPKIAKMFGLGVLCVVALVFVVSLFSSSFQSVISQQKMGSVTAMGGYGYAVAPSYEGMNDSYDAGAPANLSVRNIMPPASPSPSGDTAEDYEVVQYYASIETRKLDETCFAIADLKKLDYVIFERANESEHACEYAFKVKKANVAQVLTLINDLDPKDLSESTSTIKRQIDDFTSEQEILEKKSASINETLKNAVKAYDDLTALATRTQDVESLTKIIESKIQIIERLTAESISINNQLDRLSRAKADQLDRLEYTYFQVNVYENKYFDGENLKDSWKASLRNFFITVNQALQDATVNLIAFLFTLLQYVVYLFILLMVAKYGWRYAKRVWQK